MKKTNDSRLHSTKLIDIKNSVSHPVLRKLLKAMESPLERLLSLNRINRVFENVQNHQPKIENEIDFFDNCFKQLRVTHSLPPEDILKIPKKGPLVVIANHPFGGIEGMILGRILFSVRDDVKILGNSLLNKIPQLQKCLISVNPFGQKENHQSNASAYKHAVTWLKNGGVLIVFPAGEVSHLNLRDMKIQDPDWSPHIASLITMSKAKVLPVYIPGSNSPLFHFLGVIHPLLRTILLPRELINKKNQDLKLHFGKPIPFIKLKKFTTRVQMIQYLRFTTYFLKHRGAPKHIIPPISNPIKERKVVMQPIIEPILKETLIKEIENLSEAAYLFSQKEYVVYCTRKEHIPNIIQEIGRLREYSFREIEEGTGNPIDLDGFDDYYFQLFLWDKKREQIAGAYRLGLTRDILTKYGSNGLYTTSLFKFKSRFLSQMDRSIELGRSFIRPEYQKKHGCLSLLWRGIGEFIVRHPSYHILFGPVSISHNYHVVSKNLIVSFLRGVRSHPAFSVLVKPRTPYNKILTKRLRKKMADYFLSSIEDVSMLISEIEADGKGVPPLIKHYLKLDGNFLSFNVDKKFSNVVDGLVLVDLLKTDERILKRFMGDDGLKAFYNAHQISGKVKAA